MSQSLRDGLLALAALLGAAYGLRMLVKPQAYFGTGTPPARDRRTVRFFGGVLLAPASLMLVALAYGLLVRRQVG